MMDDFSMKIFTFELNIQGEQPGEVQTFLATVASICLDYKHYFLSVDHKLHTENENSKFRCRIQEAEERATQLGIVLV